MTAIRRAELSSLAVLLAGLALTVSGIGCHRERADAAAVADLEAMVQRFYISMAAEDADANRRAMQDIVPTADDFAALFPARHAELWKVWSPEADELVRKAPEYSPTYREALPIRGAHSVDLRREGSEALKRALAYLPPDVPARSVSIAVAKDERTTAAFLRVRNRWIWVWDLERLPDLLATPAKE